MVTKDLHLMVNDPSDVLRKKRPEKPKNFAERVGFAGSSNAFWIEEKNSHTFSYHDDFRQMLFLAKRTLKRK